VSAVRDRLMAALRPYLLRRRMVAMAEGLLLGAALAALLVAVVALTAGRSALAAPLLPGSAAVVILLPAIIRAAMPVRASEAALAIERTFPFLQDRVATAVDLLQRQADRIPRSEAAMVRIAAEATAALNDLPLRRAAPVGALRAPAMAAVLALGLAALAWSAAPVERTPPPPPVAVQPAQEPTAAPAPEPPRLFDLSISIEPPAYTRLPRVAFSAETETIRALRGSAVGVSGVCSAVDAQVSFERADGTSIPLQTTSDGRFSHLFTLSGSVRWRVAAASKAGFSATEWRAIEPVEDAPPNVRLTQPMGDLTLALAEPVEVTVVASDDFGVGELGLELQVEGADGWRSMPLGFTAGTSATASVRLNPAGVGLQPGEEMTLRAYALDNDAVGGPKRSLSAPVRIRLEATAARKEALPETPVEAAQRETADALEELQRVARQLGSELQEAIEGAMSGQADEGQPTPTRPGFELQEAARRLQDQAGRLEQAMREAEREMTEQQGTSPELVEKVRELHELMRDVLDEEMREALEELRKAVEAQDPAQMRMSLEAAREAQERFMQRLEQTLALLKRARLEALLGQLRRETQELAKRQHELTERTSDLSDGQSDRTRAAERDQRELARQAQPLPDAVEAAVEVAREADAEVAARLGAIADRLRREDPAAQMRRAESALQRGSASDAREPQQEAEQSLQRASDDLAKMEQQVAADFTAEARRKLAGMLRDALALSHSQEALSDDVRDLSEHGLVDLMRDKRPISPLRRRQSTLTDATRRLAERMEQLARETPAMDPLLPAAAQVVADEMAQAAREIEGADLGSAIGRGGNAMAGLNELARMLLETDQQLSQQTAQSALSQYMERLKSLAQRQQGLNEQTGEMQEGEGGQRMQGGGGGTSLSQMAYEQAMIRQALKQMLQQAGQGGGAQSVADQLGGVPGEMEKVEGDLRSGRLERETVERQERILEKMLEAQRSLYTKERESQERKAERPTAFAPPPSPPVLAPSLLSRPPVRVERGRGSQALPRGYEELVREYYRRLGEGGAR